MHAAKVMCKGLASLLILVASQQRKLRKTQSDVFSEPSNLFYLYSFLICYFQINLDGVA
jgi:hypothetical protein